MIFDVPADLQPKGPQASAPARRPGSVRRTSTIDATWPNGRGNGTILRGAARDLFTPVAGFPQILAQATMRLSVGADRRITGVETSPARSELSALIGGPSGSGYRAMLRETLPDEAASCSTLHLLLDDVPGAMLVSGFAFRRWTGGAALPSQAPKHDMRNVCTGLQDGSSGLGENGRPHLPRRTEPVDEIDAVADALAWHTLPAIGEVSLRRSRRLDVWVEGDVAHVDAFFQDAVTVPEGGRHAVHEYGLTATIDLAAGTLLDATPVPHVLPHHECPLAVPQAEVVVGLPLAELRPAVLSQLAGTAGCTHLNDTLRGLADVAVLAAATLAA